MQIRKLERIRTEHEKPQKESAEIHVMRHSYPQRFCFHWHRRAIVRDLCL